METEARDLPLLAQGGLNITSGLGAALTGSAPVSGLA